MKKVKIEARYAHRDSACVHTHEIRPALAKPGREQDERRLSAARPRGLETTGPRAYQPLGLSKSFSPTLPHLSKETVTTSLVLSSANHGASLGR